MYIVKYKTMKEVQRESLFFDQASKVFLGIVMRSVVAPVEIQRQTFCFKGFVQDVRGHK